MSMLEVVNLSRSYGDFKAVNGVSFKVDQGEIVGLLGHNGAGKTTIMKMLTGYLEPDAGSVTVNGIDLASQPAEVQKILGYLPESLPLYPDMIVADYLDYVAHLKGLSGEAAAEEIRRVVRETELTEKLFAPISTLSRGYQQRVGVAQAVLGNPRLLILDEPTNGLDPSQTEHMRGLIRKIAIDATVILSTHIMQEVDAICGRVLILRSGELVVDADLDELRDTRKFLLSTSWQRKEATSALNSIPGVSSVEYVGTEDKSDIHKYRVKFDDKADPFKVGAMISAKVFEAGADLYQLRREQRSLESLFLQISHAGGLEDAA